MKVLFITSSRLGDAILSTSLLHYLEKKYPFLDVTVVCGSLPADLFRPIPFCSSVILMDKKPVAGHWFHLWKELYEIRWDKVIDLRGSLIGYFLKARRRIRWQAGQNTEKHQVERLRCLIEASQPITPKLWLAAEPLKKAKSTITNPTLAVAPAANWIGKQWPLEKFIRVLKQFTAAFPSNDILLVAAPHEVDVVRSLQSALDTSHIKVLLSPDLAYVAACLAQCDVFLGNDSGLMHMAAALGIPAIGLFGPSDDKRYGPYGKEHYVVRGPLSLGALEKTPGFSYQAGTCYMNDLSFETVWTTLKQLWEHMHAKVDQLAHIPLRSKSQSLPKGLNPL